MEEGHRKGGKWAGLLHPVRSTPSLPPLLIYTHTCCPSQLLDDSLTFYSTMQNLSHIHVATCTCSSSFPPCNTTMQPSPDMPLLSLLLFLHNNHATHVQRLNKKNTFMHFVSPLRKVTECSLSPNICLPPPLFLFLPFFIVLFSFFSFPLHDGKKPIVGVMVLCIEDKFAPL